MSESSSKKKIIIIKKSVQPVTKKLIIKKLDPMKSDMNIQRTIPVEGEIHILDQADYPGLQLDYYPGFISAEIADKICEHLGNLSYVPRLGFNEKGVATRNYYHWVADNPNYIYGFSKSHHNALLPNNWTQELLDIRDQVEKKLGLAEGYYNAVLINFYPTEKSTLSAHRDNDPWLEDNPLVASISLGAIRTFRLSYERLPSVPVLGGQDFGTKLDVKLENGSLAIMGNQTQKYWKHEIIPGVHRESLYKFRYNLTFRRIVPDRAHLQPHVRSPKALAREPDLTIIPNKSETQ
jgi:alkylated DNA repair dioxygenase AlkB